MLQHWRFFGLEADGQFAQPNLLRRIALSLEPDLIAENVLITCRPIAAPMNQGVARSTVERTYSNLNRCRTAAPSDRSERELKLWTG